jgi:transposase
MLRLKNDRVDAAVIARFTRAVNPETWTPLPSEVKELQALMRRLESLVQMQQQESNRLETATATVAPGT